MTERRVGRDIMIRLSELFLEKVSFYREASRNFIFIFLLNKAGLEFLKPLVHVQKIPIFYRPSKKYSSLEEVSLDAYFLYIFLAC
jgi:hypothetical protein